MIDRGPWLTTTTGKHFHFLDPQVEDISLIDIASGLSRVCRFGGHMSMYRYGDDTYSVAQHSVYVLRRLLAEKKFRAAHWGIIHDGTEAFFNDVVSPLKELLPNYQNMEDATAQVIRDAFDVEFDAEIAGQVHEADKFLGLLEAMELSDFSKGMYEIPDNKGLTIWDIDPAFRLWRPAEARSKFIIAYQEAVMAGTYASEINNYSIAAE